MKVITEADIFRAYQAAAGLKPAEMARQLEISPQRMHNFFQGTQPMTETVLDWFLKGAAAWIKEMALDIFKHRPEHEVPCMCQTEIGDNGPCPRHAAILVEE